MWEAHTVRRMSALREVRYVLHGVAVWLVWSLLTGTPFHDRSYGELRRLTAPELAARLAPIAVVGVVAAHLYTSVSVEIGSLMTFWMSLWAMSGVVLVASTLLATRIVDWRLLHA